MFLDILLGRNKGDLLTPDFKFEMADFQEAAESFLETLYGLRFEVYCNECKYLEASDYPSGKEIDELEYRSTHVGAFNFNDEIIGTVRLVRASGADNQFPWEQHCVPFEHVTLPPPELAGEVSRLVVHKRYRRRSGDTREGVAREIAESPNKKVLIAAGSHHSCRKRRTNAPQILLGMYRELYRYSRANGIKFWYAAMERKLANSLNKMGFPFKEIGPEVDYYGPVTPYIADLDQLNAELKQVNPLLSAWFNDQPIGRWLVLKTMAKYAMKSARS